MKTTLPSRNRCYGSVLLILLCSSAFLLPPACDATPFAGGTGEPNDPYQVASAEDLASIGADPNLLYKHLHYVLVADIDLVGKTWTKAVIPGFSGTFDGNGLAIRHLTIRGEERYLGLFGQLFGEVRDLKVLDAIVISSEDGDYVGGLTGLNTGHITNCYTTGSIQGNRFIGGLVGFNDGSIINCYSTRAVSGAMNCGGLAGGSDGSVTQCYSTGAVTGIKWIGGVVGGSQGPVINCFWDTQNSGVATSTLGIGLTTAQMHDPRSFLDTGWDFVGETANGSQDIWVMPANSYPRLAWELAE